MSKKIIALILSLCFIFGVSPAVAASNYESPAGEVTRSVDTSFDLAFSEASTWTFNFDNEAGWFHFNHTHVEVYYDSYTEAGYSPIVTVKLQELVDGSYETVETVNLLLGKSKIFELPNGGTLTDYRLSFTANSKATCTFSVKSYRG